MDLASSLTDLTTNPPKPRNGPLCSVCILLDDLAPAERDALQAALDSTRVTTSAIVEILKQAGYHATLYTIGHHRRRQCRGQR